MIRKRINTEKVISIDIKGNLINYPQSNITIKKKKINTHNLLNKPKLYIPDEEYLNNVKSKKLYEDYEKRIKAMMYRATIAYWKEFESVMINIFDRLETISTEEGNKLQVIKKVEKRELIIGLA